MKSKPNNMPKNIESVLKSLKDKMSKYLNLIIITSISLILLNGCNNKSKGYIAATSITKNGFARHKESIQKLNGSKIRIWGYVDHCNIYADDVNEILADWRAGNGPNPTTWRFNLKAKPDDNAGESFAVYVKNDKHREKLLKNFIADAKAAKPTRVFVKGKILAFDAPINFRTLTSLRIEVESAKDILLEYPVEPTQKQ